MDDLNMKYEERVAWICALGLMTIIAGVALWNANATARAAEKALQTPPPEPGIVARLDALEARAEAQAKMRCFNVNTDRLDAAIFPVENLGVKKVAKP